MKKTIALLLALVMSTVTLCSCVQTQTDPDNTNSDASEWVNPYKDINIDEYVTLGQYKDFEVSVEKEAVTDEQVDYYATYYYSQSFSSEESDKTVVSDGDTVVVSYAGYIDGEQVEAATAEEDEIIVGYSQMIPGFVEGLIGAELDSVVGLDLQFPEDYTTNETYSYLNGKDVHFDVTIKEIRNTVIPTKDEFAQEQGYEDYDDYVADLRAYLESYTEDDYKNALADAVITFVIEHCEKLEIPETVKAGYLAEYETTYSEYAAYYGDEYTWDSLFEASTGMTPEAYAEAQIKQEMVMLAVAEKENLTVTDEFYEEEMTMVKTYFQEQYYTAYTDEDIIEMFGEDYLNYQFRADYTRTWIEGTVVNTVLVAE